MCRIFAGQDPRNYSYETKSIRLMGYSTSIRLEERFWFILEKISADQEMTLPQFLSTLHQEAESMHGEISNFTSLLRCCCLTYLNNGLAGQKLEAV